MLDTLFGLVAPHLCCYCGDIGAVLCDNCKYNIENDASARCLACGDIARSNGLCGNCVLPYSRAWCVGDRSGELRRLIDCYKFEGVRAGYRPIAELIHRRIGQLPKGVIVVPVPTVASHRRVRGYDHAALIAGETARLQGVSMRQVLRRRTRHMQRGADRPTRLKQAKGAFEPGRGRIVGSICLLVDDVSTTGATLAYGAKALKQMGAEDVWVAVAARQPLD